jgi:RNA polymerase sigma-70 factor (ECF subfamily)
MTDKVVPFRRAARAAEDDETLIAACCSDDRAALEELFRRHGKEVRRIVTRLRYVAKADLDDVLQNTFFEVYRSASGYNARASVRTWIVGIAMNVVRHYVRAEARRKNALSLLAVSPPQPEGARPDEKVAAQQIVAQLRGGFESLSEDLRIVFTLCDLEEMRSIDVARALDIPEGTVWRRLHNARRRLRKALQEPSP